MSPEKKADSNSSRNQAQAAEPVRVKLSFEPSRPRPISGLPAHLSLSTEAKSTLGLLPKQLQHEIIELIASERNGAKKIPDATNTFVAKTTNGYRVVYKSQNDEKAIVQIVTPSQLAGFIAHAE